MFRLSRIRGKVAYATKAEHDFRRPARLRPARRTPTAPTGSSATTVGTARDPRLRAHRLAGRAPLRPLRRDRAGRRRRRRVHAPTYANTRLLVAWVLGLGEHARVEGPPELVAEVGERLALLAERHDAGPRARRGRAAARGGRRGAGHARTATAAATASRDPPRALRPPRHARLDPHRRRARRPSGCAREDVCERLQISDQELREDVNVLNVVNFGGGSYVLYAEVGDDGMDRGRPRALLGQLRPPRPAAAGRGQGARRRDRPDRRAPARGLARPPRARRSSPRSAPTRWSRASRSPRPAATTRRSRALVIAARSPRAGCCGWSTTSPTRTSSPTRTVEPYALINGREGWYVASFDPARTSVRHFRLDRIKRRRRVLDETFEPRPEVDPAADVEGWPRTGEVPGVAERARLDLARARPLGARGAHRRRGARRRRGRRRAAVRRRRLARARGPQGGRRRRRARARGRARRRGPSAGLRGAARCGGRARH